MAKFKRSQYPQKKLSLVTDYRSLFEQSNAAYVLKYEGITVEHLTKIRRDLEQHGSSLKVIKNRLAKLSVQGTQFEKLSESFVQGTAVVFDREDSLETVKQLVKACKDFDKLKLLSGIFAKEGSFYEEQDLVALSKLPSREELIVQLLFLFNATTTKFVRTLNEIPASFVRVLDQIAQQKA